MAETLVVLSPMENGTWLVSLIFSQFEVFGEILYFVHTHIHPCTRYILRGCVLCYILYVHIVHQTEPNQLNPLPFFGAFLSFLYSSFFCFNFFCSFCFFQEFLERRTVWRTTVVQSPMSISPSQFTSGDQEIQIIFSFHLKWTVKKMLHLKFKHNVNL